MTLHYTGGSVVMADDVAEALIQYARELAATKASDVLVVPVVGEDGTLATAEFLIGPASQLLAVPTEGAESGRDQGVIDDIDRRARLLRPPTAVAHAETDAAQSIDLDSSAP
ncbi:hypothetical protein BH10ACT5_BH10ACT5_17070 [soil metagenome]